MVNPEQLRVRAEQCEAKAETAHDPEVRLLYRNVAAQWRRMARQHEELDIGVGWCSTATRGSSATDGDRTMSPGAKDRDKHADMRDQQPGSHPPWP